VFNELAKMFGSSKKERRHSPRKKVKFPLVWLTPYNEQIAAVGMEMSLNGCLMATKQAPMTPAFDTIVDLGSRKIRLRLNTARSGTIMQGGTPWTVLGCSFSGVAADDYDALVRFLKGMADAENKAQKDLAAIDKTDDAYRMLPSATQHRVLTELVRLGRLAMPQGNQQPLLRMSKLGTDKGKQRVAVHSRVAADGGMLQFDTIMVIDGPNVKVEIDKAKEKNAK
jgi:hypothetical protein